MYISAPIGAENFFGFLVKIIRGDPFDDFSFFSSLGGDPSKDPPPVITPLAGFVFFRSKLGGIAFFFEKSDKKFFEIFPVSGPPHCNLLQKV